MLEDRILRISREIFLAAFGVPLETVNSWTIDRLTAVLDEHEVRAGQSLLTAGEPAEYVYFMQDGEVRFTREGGPSWTFRGRWVLGAFEVLSERPSRRTGTAVTDFSVMRVRASSWAELFEDSFQLARSAVTNAARVVARIEERLPEGVPVADRGSSSAPTTPAGTSTLVDRLARLMDVPMLRGAGVQALADLAAASQAVSFAQGDLLERPGAEREHLIYVVDGEVRAERADPPVVRHYGPGDLVGGAASLGGVLAWEARAVTATQALAIPIEGLFDLMEEHFDLVRSAITAFGAERELLLDRLAATSGSVVLS